MPQFKVVDAMEGVVKNSWYAVAGSVRSTGDCAKIAGAFAYEGFRLELPAK
jgi:hypothetical protein